MTRIEAIIDGKFLSVCPVTEAVAWLKEKRGGKSKLTSLSHPDSASSQETVLAERDDPYIDFGLARYGTSEACKPVYERGDLGIKCTFLAHFPNGGYALSFQGFFFKLSATQPSEVNELCALVTNPTLADRIFEDCFEKKGAFASLSEENYQMVLASVADNRRLMTPYDETYFDGYSRFSYHQVFHQAWNLAARVPNTVDWANILYNLTYRCLPPLGFDPMPIFPRWHFEVKEGSDHKNSGFFLRSRLADVLEPNDILLKSTDPALREQASSMATRSKSTAPASASTASTRQKAARNARGQTALHGAAASNPRWRSPSGSGARRSGACRAIGIATGASWQFASRTTRI